MLSKRISAAILMLMLFSFSIGSFVKAFLADGVLSLPTQSFLEENLPLGRTLKKSKTRLRYALGEREQNGVFISDGRLIENISPPVEAYLNQNTQAILSFSERQSVPSYVTLIPTASAILQEQVPSFAQVVDQKRLIENVYKSFAGKLSCIDVYSTLFQNREQHIYYNTETLLSPQGGYYVYNVIARRTGLTPYPMFRFEIDYLGEALLGNLSRQIEYEDLHPDRLGVYRFTGSKKEFSVTHENGSSRVYNTLYPVHFLGLEQPLSVYLGGLSSSVKIQQRQRSQGNILVFGDLQALSVVPFLACSFQSITLVNLEKITEPALVSVTQKEYDAVLFLYSTGTFMHSNQLARLSKLSA